MANPLSSSPLLCERCGYDLASLKAGSVCPECALPIADSLPASRPGSAWQRMRIQGPLLLPIGWALTVVRGVISPGRQMRRASIETRSARALLHVNVLFSAIVLSSLSAAPFRIFLVAVWPQGVTSPALLFGATWPLFAGLTAFLAWTGVLLGLTWIERIGVQFYSRRRGWRVTPAVSLVATAHASGAWLLAAAFAAALPHALGILSQALPAQLSAQLSGFRIALAPSGFIAGMVWFEIATFLGIRSSRFANPPDAGSAPA